MTTRAIAAEAESTVRRGIPLVDVAVLGLIALVVFLVSLPRLRSFALKENETDAVRALRVLAEDAVAHPEALDSGGIAGLLAASSGHRLRLEDVEILPDARLRRHGYLFASAEPAPGRRILLAWPWEHGRTGFAVFAADSSGALRGLSNADGRFSGPGRPPPAPPDGGTWVELPPE